MLKCHELEDNYRNKECENFLCQKKSLRNTTLGYFHGDKLTDSVHVWMYAEVSGQVRPRMTPDFFWFGQLSIANTFSEKGETEGFMSNSPGEDSAWNTTDRLPALKKLRVF